ncbi:MAG: hypothetical protein IAI48_00395 [Candidatus Eremiobacteraeota bacterium]|nr:hypothetical protein [Candidatus Eremiobacteraeota bacterium]
MYTADPVSIYDGKRAPHEVQAAVREAMAPIQDDFASYFGWDGEHVRAMCEAFVAGGIGKRAFSFTELERQILAREGHEGKPQNRYEAREAITTSQNGAAIGLIVMHAIEQAYEVQPAIFRDLAEVTTSNGESEVYPEEFYDDLPVPTAETEPSPESRMGQRNVRITNYGYTRRLAISKRYFELDKSGMTKRFASNFGKKYPIAQDRAFVNGMFKTGVPANLIQNGGLFPGTNIAGYGPGNGFGTGTAYGGVTGVPASYNPQASPLTPAAIENALLAPATFVDPYGIEIGAGLEFDTLLVDSLDRYKAKRFVQSNVNPVQLLTTGDPNGLVAAGQASGSFTDNVLKGEFTVAHSPYVKKSRAPLSGSGFPWSMFKKGENGFVMQIERDWTTEQEVPNAGDSFTTRSFIWQGEGWFGAGFRTGRLTYFGN